MSKIKFELEFPIHASASMLYTYFGTPAGLEEWFADKVNSRSKFITFIWDGVEEQAKILINKTNERVKYKWMESEDDESYFEFRIEIDAITKDVSLMITDFADSKEDVAESKMLWENQIEELKHTIGA
ncbi:MAG: START-like domain-containing protein [Polaribacter sp.]|nr:START-like domain-containing protein [Polaribacter sp.]